MLNPEGTCALPISQLQPSAPPHTVRVPNVQFFGDYTLLTEHGYEIQVIYDVQHELWRSAAEPDRVVWLTRNNKWRVGWFSEWQSIRETLQRPTHLNEIALPNYPLLPVDTQEIPRQIHQIWIGKSMPGQDVIDTIARNTANTADFKVTLHTDVSDELFLRLTNRLKEVAPKVVVIQLNETAFFDHFKTTEIHQHYLNASTREVTTYSAACDMLRYPLVNHYGGIYMDLDDWFINPLGEHAFRAAYNDVLLGRLISHYGADFKGYNSSIFASAANNPVLTEISKEVTRRCDGATDFFSTPRADIEDQSYSEYNAYVSKLFRLTGPQVFNDVLARERPDYYSILFNLSPHHGPLERYKVLDTAYDAKLTRVAEHYFPFAEKARVKIGSAHTWLST